MAELSAWRCLSCAVWTKIAAEILSRIWCDRLLCQALAESGSVPWRWIGRFSGLLYIPHAGRAKNLIFQHDWKIESWNPQTYQRGWNLSEWKFLCSPGDNVSHGIRRGLVYFQSKYTALVFFVLLLLINGAALWKASQCFCTYRIFMRNTDKWTPSN